MNATVAGRKIAAIIVGPCALAALGAGAWLAHRTAVFVSGPDDASEHGAVGNGSGYGIFLPSWLLVGLGAFLVRFAWKLRKDESR